MEFFVAGTPVAQGSKKHVGKGIMVEMGKGLKPWRDSVIAMAYRHSGRASKTFVGPVSVDLSFYFLRPKHHFGTGRNADRLKGTAPIYKQTYPDLDKLCRAVLDGLVQGGALRDDSLVVSLFAEKKFDPRPGARVVIRDVHN